MGCDLLSFFELTLIDTNLCQLCHLRYDGCDLLSFFELTLIDTNQAKAKTARETGCDLLSFFELTLIDTNLFNWRKATCTVVICFRSLN